MTVDEALKYVISLGMVVPDDLPPKGQPDPQKTAEQTGK